MHVSTETLSDEVGSKVSAYLGSIINMKKTHVPPIQYG